MAENSGRAATRLEPETSWTIVTEAPLKGLALAREAGRILAWDEGNQLYLLSVQGESMSFSRVPQRIAAGTISDEGSVIALLGDGDDAGLLILNADFEIEVERPAPSESSFVSLDSHGRFLAVGSRLGAVSFFNKFGRPAGRLETIQPLAHVCFLPDRPFLVGAAAFGMLVGVDIEGARSATRLDPEIAWQDRLMSNVGRLTVSGDGGMVLASCFTHGIQRFDLRGRNEGSYHLGGTVSHAVPDFPGRTIVAATLEGELAVMNSGGNVRWRTRLPRPPIALEVDPLGRYVIYGHSTGEIVRLDLFGGQSDRKAVAVGSAAAASGGRLAGARTTATGAVRQPDWTAPAVQSEQQAESAVLAVTDDPACIALFTSPHQLQLYNLAGQRLGQGQDMTGVGRILRTAPGWLAAATDRQIVLYDLRRSTSRRLDLSLVELTHLEIRPDTYGLALVQERDRIGRVTASGRWIWKRELKSPVEDLVIGPEGFAAATDNLGQLLVFDPAGEPTVGARFDPSDPPLLVDASDGSPAGVVWIAFSRRAQQLTAHDLRGKVLWNRQVPFEGWSLTRLGRYLLAMAADGRVIAYDGDGSPRLEGGDGSSSDQFVLDEGGQPLRVARKGVHLICSGLEGRIRWRAVSDHQLGPFATGPAGVAILIGYSLGWFKISPAVIPEGHS